MAVLGLVDELAAYVTAKVLFPVTLPLGTVHHDVAFDDADHVILDVTPTLTVPEPAGAVPVLVLRVRTGAGVLPLCVKL